MSHFFCLGRPASFRYFSQRRSFAAMRAFSYVISMPPDAFIHFYIWANFSNYIYCHKCMISPKFCIKYILRFSYSNHKMVVDIPYTERNYSIIYRDSENLRYNEKKNTIHPRYNKWVIRLSRCINNAITNSL